MSHSLFTQRKMAALMDAIAEGKSMAQATAIAYGSRSKVGWVHVRNSRKEKEAGTPLDECKYYLRDWPEEGEHHHLCDAYRMAVEIAKLDFSMETLAEIRQSTRPVIEGGRVMHRVSDWQIATFKDAEEAANFGFHDFPYEHDERGARIPLRVRDRVGNMLTLAALKAISPDIWNVEQKVTVDRAKNPGVLTLGQHRPQAQPSALVTDLNEKLRLMREAGPNRPTARPSGIVDLGNGGRSAGDPQERISTPSDQSPADLSSHPRAYHVERPTPKPQEPVSYARPKKATRLDFEDQAPPSGGRSVFTGRYT